MRRETATGLLLGLLLGLARAGVAGERPAGDDDLAVVKRAVAGSEAAAPNREPREAKAPRPSPCWVKVRIVENGGHTSRVSVTLPLPSSHPRIREVLRELESGRPLVELRGADSTVRVFVE